MCAQRHKKSLIHKKCRLNFTVRIILQKRFMGRIKITKTLVYISFVYFSKENILFFFCFFKMPHTLKARVYLREIK